MSYVTRVSLIVNEGWCRVHQQRSGAPLDIHATSDFDLAVDTGILVRYIVTRNQKVEKDRTDRSVCQLSERVDMEVNRPST